MFLLRVLRCPSNFFLDDVGAADAAAIVLAELCSAELRFTRFTIFSLCRVADYCINYKYIQTKTATSTENQSYNGGSKFTSCGADSKEMDAYNYQASV